MSTEDVPVGEFTLPLGQAAVVREGSDITLVGWGAQVREKGGGTGQGHVGGRGGRSNWEEGGCGE